MDLGDTSKATRRRGLELEEALLEAAWAQLVSGGYGAFTFDAIAERAGTSKPVIYRRWSTRHDLVLAAIRHAFTQSTIVVPDTGSLRGDVVAFLSLVNETRAGMAAIISVQLGSFYQENATTPADLREELLRDRTSSMEVMLQRAVARGEIATAVLPTRILGLPADLLRQESLMTLRAVPAESIEEIVDLVFLPLVS